MEDLFFVENVMYHFLWKESLRDKTHFHKNEICFTQTGEFNG